MKKYYILLCSMIILGSCQQQIKSYKMTTKIPDGIAMPRQIDSRIGILDFQDGIPSKVTLEKIYENLDFNRALSVYIQNIQLASIEAIKQGVLELGKANSTVLIHEDFADSKTLILTANASSIYFHSWLEVREPMVIETPKNVLGFINNRFFEYEGDFGNAGPDMGQGGKYLIIPPDYTGNIPNGYHIIRTSTYGNWIVGRGFSVDGDPKPTVENIKDTFKIYPLAETPKTLNFINMSGTFYNTIFKMTDDVYYTIDDIIQSEPIDTYDSTLLGELRSLGIEKGKKFNPDNRMKRILKEAANVGAATLRTLAAFPREEEFQTYTNSKVWINPFAGGSNFTSNNARLIDHKAIYYFFAIGITPAMVKPRIGKGSQYAYAYMDKDHKIFDGSKTYKIHLPANIPAKNFWSFTVYDNQTRSMLQTDHPTSSIDSYNKELKQNEDGSYDIYFGPKPPKGWENNWIQTIPGKGWNTLFRIYGPLEPWFDKTWQLSDPILVKN